MKKLETGLSWVIILIFLQTLYFKFTGAEESRWIFSQMGMEPWGRYLTGVGELVAALLLMGQRLRVWGALMAFGLMGGAVLSHLFVLGISVHGDGGLLFALALISLLSSGFVLSKHLKQLPFMSMVGFVLCLPGISLAKIDYNTESASVAQGYDTVSYVIEQKAVPGKKEFTSKHDGATFLFSSASNKEKFDKAPEKFIPAFGGWCAYAMAEGDKVDIDPKSFKVIDGKTYLFYNGVWGDTLKKWNKDEPALKKKADAHWLKIIK